MNKNISDVRVSPWLGLCIFVFAIILCFTEMSSVRAENGGPNPDKSEATSSQKTTVAVTPAFDEKALINSIGILMDDKLAPLFQKQATLEKLLLEDKFSGPKMTDIVGGIGWILGLGGIAAFFLSFKRRPRK
jgi:nickel transport protein